MWFPANSSHMLMRPNKAETAVRGCHSPGDMAVRMRKVLARPWVGVRVCHMLLLLLKSITVFSIFVTFESTGNYDYGLPSKKNIMCHAIFLNEITLCKSYGSEVIDSKYCSAQLNQS